MVELHFTAKVLGTLPAYKLGKRQVTQTIRAESTCITQAVIQGRLKVGDQVEVTLDGTKIGTAEFTIMDPVNWTCLNIKDAWRGGFNSLEELERALKRAGYRFMPLHNYKLFRIQFSWLEYEVSEENKEKMTGRALW